MTPPARALTVVVTVPEAEAELASDALWRLGAAAIEELEVGDRVQLRAALGEDRHRLRRLLEVWRWPWRFEYVDLDVADTWRQTAEPTVVDDRIVVVPAWRDDPGGTHDIRLVIEPGPTFGMGNHPTTVLSLRALHREVRPGDTVLDVGTGSGVLAIGAVCLGAAHARGTDINPASPDVGTANAVRNGVADRVELTGDPLEGESAPYDIVVANILAPTLIELAPHLRRLTGRVLILSGLLEGRVADVVAAMAPLQLRETLVLDGWVALILS